MASSQMNRVLPALATACAGTLAITFACKRYLYCPLALANLLTWLDGLFSTVGSASKPSAQHLLVRAQSEKQDVNTMKPRLTKHPSGAFIPKASHADGK